MEAQIKHKGKTFKYMMRYAGYLLYGCHHQRILVDEWGHVVHEYVVSEARMSP